MLRRHGFRAMTVEQIARAAGTTRTTFYQYFKSKSDLIYFLQEAYIGPEMVAISVKLDAIVNPTWQSLRDWITEYSRTWDRIHIFLEAYSDALLTDPAVAATAIPNTYRVTAHMTNILSRFAAEERERAHGKLVILLSVVSQMLSLTHAQREDARDSRLLDGFTDLFWEGFFAKLPKQPRTSVKRQ
jgi:AcrR family transcriptional regulator